jgi:hypothetical protein
MMLEKEKSRTARMRLAVRFPLRMETRATESNNPCAPPINKRMGRTDCIFMERKISLFLKRFNEVGDS